MFLVVAEVVLLVEASDEHVEGAVPEGFGHLFQASRLSSRFTCRVDLVLAYERYAAGCWKAQDGGAFVEVASTKNNMANETA